MTTPARRTLAMQGSRTGRSSYALVNARWSASLTASGEFEVIDYDPQSATPPDVLVHHDFATHFLEFNAPPGTPSVAVRTWDFGPLPPAWARKVNAQFAQYWAHTRWIERQALAAGVEQDRIRVVPHGVDPLVFRPDGIRYQLPTTRSFAFLFVGGISFRKGSDTLLSAYRKAFSSSDDVVLVLKDNSRDLFYRDDTIRNTLAQMKSDPTAPEVVHIDRFLPEEELAALYRGCDVAVFPYRAEGFCVPILECMACGTPAIVPRFGACLDYCSDDTSYFVGHRRIHVPVNRRLTVALGFTDEVDEVDFCEVPVDILADHLLMVRNEAVAHRALKSAAGVRVAHDRFSWQQAFEHVHRCLAELA